jgi:hypothetical protein
VCEAKALLQLPSTFSGVHCLDESMPLFVSLIGCSPSCSAGGTARPSTAGNAGRCRSSSSVMCAVLWITMEQGRGRRTRAHGLIQATAVGRAEIDDYSPCCSSRCSSSFEGNQEHPQHSCHQVPVRPPSSTSSHCRLQMAMYCWAAKHIVALVVYIAGEISCQSMESGYSAWGGVAWGSAQAHVISKKGRVLEGEHIVRE